MPKSERQAQILTIAQDLFATHGFHHISMDDIAERAEVSKPILYRHFPSKLDLYLAVIDERGQALVDSVALALVPVRAAAAAAAASGNADRDVDGYAVVHAVVRAYVDFADGCGVAASLLFESDVTRDDVVRERVEEPNRRNAELFASALATFTDLTESQTLTVARTATAMARVAASDSLRAHRDADTARAADGETSMDTAELVAQFAWRGIHGMVRREVPSEGR
jgi:AcrR family transcriptional regulator